MSYLAKNYNRKKISFKFGKGSYLFSSTGKKYLDFVQGIAVNSLGHAHPKLIKASHRPFHPSQTNGVADLSEHALYLSRAPLLKLSEYFASTSSEARS